MTVNCCLQSGLYHCCLLSAVLMSCYCETSIALKTIVIWTFALDTYRQSSVSETQHSELSLMLNRYTHTHTQTDTQRDKGRRPPTSPAGAWLIQEPQWQQKVSFHHGIMKLKSTFCCPSLIFCDLFTALHEMQTRSSDENSVCLSVTRVIPDKMEERSVQIFMPYERTFILVFREEEWLVGGDPLYVKFWVNRPQLERNRRFSTSNRS